MLLGSNKLFIVSEVTVPGLRHAKQLVEAIRAVEPALHEPLETPEFGNVKARLADVSLFIEMNGNFPVSFDTGYRVDDDLSCSHSYFRLPVR